MAQGSKIKPNNSNTFSKSKPPKGASGGKITKRKSNKEKEKKKLFTKKLVASHTQSIEKALASKVSSVGKLSVLRSLANNESSGKKTKNKK